jgi:hypothetical protein
MSRVSVPVSRGGATFRTANPRSFFCALLVRSFGARYDVSSLRTTWRALVNDGHEAEAAELGAVLASSGHAVPGNGTNEDPEAAGETRYVRVKDYVKSFESRPKSSDNDDNHRDVVDSPPAYSFNGPVQEEFRRALTEHLGLFLEHGQAIPGARSAAGLQFYLGAPASGAHMHYHGAAINLQVWGVKRWAVTHPNSPVTSYSFASGAEFMAGLRGVEEEASSSRVVGRTATTDLGGGQSNGNMDGSGAQLPQQRPAPPPPAEEERVWQFTQYAGDLVVLPDNWGHATVNVEASVGAAYIFDYCDGGR